MSLFKVLRVQVLSQAQAEAVQGIETTAWRQGSDSEGDWKKTMGRQGTAQLTYMVGQIRLELWMRLQSHNRHDDCDTDKQRETTYT